MFKSKAALRSLAVAVSVVTALVAVSCNNANQTQSPPTKPQLTQSQRSLSLIFEGTWAFVVAPDGSVTAYTPKLPPNEHSKPYIRGIDEQQLESDEYTVAIDKYVPPNRTDYDGSAPYKEFNLFYTLPINTNSKEYLSIHLPKPTSFQHQHLDSQEFKDADPGNTPAQNPHDYPTVMALRYDLTDVTAVSVTCKKNCLQPYSPGIPALGNEQYLNIEVDPLNPDDDHHSHARKAFHTLVGLFPEFNLWVAFPASTPAGKKGAKNIASPLMVNGPGKDCRASVLLLQPK